MSYWEVDVRKNFFVEENFNWHLTDRQDLGDQDDKGAHTWS